MSFSIQGTASNLRSPAQSMKIDVAIHEAVGQGCAPTPSNATAFGARSSRREIFQRRCGDDQSGAWQGGGVASLHRPVRTSELPGPELSSLGGAPTQPDTSQAAARTRIINFTDC